MSSLLRVACSRAEACDCNPRTRPCSAPSPLLSDASFSWARRGGCLAANSSSFFLHTELFTFLHKNLVNFLQHFLTSGWLARGIYMDFFSIFLFSAVLNTHRKYFFSSFLFFQLYIFSSSCFLARSLSLSSAYRLIFSSKIRAQIHTIGRWIGRHLDVCGFNSRSHGLGRLKVVDLTRQSGMKWRTNVRWATAYFDLSPTRVALACLRCRLTFGAVWKSLRTRRAVALRSRGARIWISFRLQVK